MTSTKAEPGPYDALEKAQDEEIIFVLLARDEAAPATINFWVDLRRKSALGLVEHDPEAAKLELQKCTEAEAVAWEMDRWRKGHPAEDTTTPRRATYSGTVCTSNADTAQAQRRIAIVSALREAAYFATNAVELLSDGSLHGVEEADALIALTAAIQTIKDADAALAPRHSGAAPA